ncbi:MAG TPA: fused MFS/spermidine synthase [Noviherbaspirillum sp.]
MQGTGAATLSMRKRIPLVLLYGSTIFLSAFLLFQVQPVIGKVILPWFGGSAAVWSACLLFFQVVLLLGYLYAHWTSRLLAPRRQALLHALLLLASLSLLPLTPDARWRAAGSDDPTWLIMGLLTVTIGLPYFLLSTTGPLLQAWFAREAAGIVPYRLFALSNLGSMLGLLSYPVLFEPALSMPEMSVGWSAAYAVFAVLCAALAMRAMRMATAVYEPDAHAAIARPSIASLSLWAALAACPTVLLMGVTSHLTQNVAPVPFLWVVPLALYLLSFILCFESEGWYRRKWYLPLFLVWLAVMQFDLIKPISTRGVWFPVVLYGSGLFVSCMLCHGELARMKPHPRHLTAFFLMIALGGAVGGSFVALAAPRLFNNYYELPAAAIVTALLIATIVDRDQAQAPGTLTAKSILPKAMAVAIALISILAAIGIARQNSMHRVLVRNFYGTLRVDDIVRNGVPERQLAHGAILHGTQLLESGKRNWPTSYYGDNGGAGMAILATRTPGGAQRVGVIGLGTGTVAAYGRAGDHYRFYEINPLVAELARRQFSYLSESPARIDIAMGDARQSLEREQPQQYDVLVVDAFSGDAIPVHLLTREAFAVYFRHVRQGGILAVHISNRNLDLAPVVKHASDHYGKVARLVEAERVECRKLSKSSWVLISNDAETFGHEAFSGRLQPLVPASMIRPWTDDYSSIYTILK